MKTVIVIGGGAAGWLSALYTRHRYPTANVTLIEDVERGILGAGESTLGLFVGELRKLDINPELLVKHCKSTIKLGTRFVNWGDKDYILPFKSRSSVERMDEINIKSTLSEDDTLNLYKSLINDNKVPYESGDLIIDNNHAYNIDAALFAETLKSIALSRNVIHVDDVVLSFENDCNGEVKTINTKKGVYYPDFVFDCSGFARLLIGKHYDTEWISYTKHLPVNSALPFFMNVNPDHTESAITATAMNAGWSWRIPLQHRYGCGYVFDDKYISFEEAEIEVRAKFGDDIFIPNKFKFKPGAYRDVFVKNCAAVGLSSGFIEPLEASSILGVLTTLREMVDTDFLYYNEKSAASVNNIIQHLNETNIGFIYAHYICGRNDTLFWQNFSTDTVKPKVYTDVLDILNRGDLIENYKSIEPHTNVYSSYLWINVLYNTGQINDDVKALYIGDESLKGFESYTRTYNEQTFPLMWKQTDYIKMILGKEVINTQSKFYMNAYDTMKVELNESMKQLDVINSKYNRMEADLNVALNLLKTLSPEGKNHLVDKFMIPFKQYLAD